MTDPAAGVVAAAASLSAIFLALVGVDYYSLAWGLGGALVMLTWSEKRLGRTRACLTVWASTITAAAIAHLLVDSVDGQRSMLVGVSFCVGAGAQHILRAGIEAITERLKRWGEGQ
jgi:ABC-type amino acid transport system permease subunit